MQHEHILPATHNAHPEHIHHLTTSTSTSPIEGLIEGRIVHYVLSNGEHRPAIVVRVFESGRQHGLANLIVFSDGSNDAGVVSGNVSAQGLFWATSAHYDQAGTEHHTWHWMSDDGKSNDV